MLDRSVGSFSNIDEAISIGIIFIDKCDYGHWLYG